MGGHWGPHFSLGAAPWPPVEPPLSRRAVGTHQTAFTDFGIFFMTGSVIIHRDSTVICH